MQEFRQAISRLSQFPAGSAGGSSIPAGTTAYAAISRLNGNEQMLAELFEGIDFNHTGTIDYSEFLAACLARKEGLKREYAELIFDLWPSGDAPM